MDTLLAKVELQPGAPWGGAGTILNSMHEMGLARKGRTLAPQLHQRTAWSRRPGPRPAEVVEQVQASPDIDMAAVEAAPLPRPQSAHAVPQAVGSTSDQKGLAAAIRASMAMPAAGLSVAEVRGKQPRRAPILVAQCFDSAGFLSQLECPMEVLQTPLEEGRAAPRLEKTALDEIRADHSAAEQVGRGRIQSAVQPGIQPAPQRPDWAIHAPRTAHPHGGPHLQRKLWQGARSEAAHVGASRAWSASPRWAPVRCGSSIVRLQRVGTLDAGCNSRMPLPTPKVRRHREGSGKASGTEASRVASAIQQHPQERVVWSRFAPLMRGQRLRRNSSKNWILDVRYKSSL
eukprot:CAMPEP_0115583006 /NCGR_PEP_ID=MMETSP0272-20121206/5952_1 /TAXON_ID=71861 /ORGANISM="Scrippsiella trochoidea, Strain CCMP3099" /LENGTH=344 /DNA_ID=CAMNT_0003018009 /DNA_START=36 /DNA_END=1067 /DNA_ORIENTATION=+